MLSNYFAIGCLTRQMNPKLKTYQLSKSIFVWTFLWSMSFISFGQEIKVADRYDEYFGVKDAQSKAVYLALRADGNLNDASLGGALGVINEKRNIIFFGSFDARPFRKKTLEYMGRNTFYQFRESRYFIGFGAEYQHTFNDSPYGAFVQINPEYTWGGYAGSNQKATSGWFVAPRVGVFKKVGASTVSLGYAMVNAKNDDIQRNRIYLSFNNVFGRIR